MFEIKEIFYLNGEPFQIVSGSFHYFRTVPEYWRDRLEKIKNMGCNTVETYIPWNFHEPKKGEFLWDGMRNISRFIELTREVGLYLIVRPSPYICAEWEFGGLPAWLLKDKNMRLRCSYEPYLHAVKEYYEVLMPKLTPHQVDRGGNIILVQIENEYGYYGNDTTYLEFLRDTMRELGITVPFVTSDGPWSESGFRAGMVEGALPTGNFGSGVEWQFETMKRYIGDDKPLMCMEFWNGWFDAWGDTEHHTTEAEKVAKELDDLMRLGHLNFYMLEGGTSFGFMSGKNNGCKTCDVTSYDYDSLLTEDGQITKKYELCKEVISRYKTIEEVPLSMEMKRKAYGQISCSGKVDLFSVLEDISAPVHSLYPLTMEEMDQSYGYLLYRMVRKEQEPVTEIALEGAADRVQGYLNGQPVFTAFAENIWETFKPEWTDDVSVIDLLCENMSRENFGTGLERQRKGISEGVRVNGHRHLGFDMYPLPLDEPQIGALNFDGAYTGIGPAFYRFDFEIEEQADTFLDLEGFGKGCAFINGFNLGRFWEIGPQKRLYLPGPLLKLGKNSIIVFETEGKSAEVIRLEDEPKLG